MMSSSRLISIAALAVLITAPARADDDSDYVWQSDGEVRQTVRQTGGIEKQSPGGLTQVLLAEASAAPAAAEPKTEKDSKPKPLRPKAPAPLQADVPPPPAAAPPTVVPRPKRDPLPGTPFREEPPLAKPLAPPAAPSDALPIVEGLEAPASDADGEEPWYKLFKLPALEARRIDVRGWLEQGYTWNPDRPANRFNGPVAYNDRSNEYMLNQMVLVAERTVKSDEGEWDWGGRIDLLYGTDYRFVRAIGLETEWNQPQRFYGLGLPQMYGEVGFNKLTVRAGHFYAPRGYETVTAPDNFFYSHSYTFVYGQPTTITGAMFKYKLNDRLSVNAGVDAGWNAWESINDKLGCFAGFNWTSPDEKTTVAFELFFNNQQPTGENVRSHYAFVLTRKLTDRLSYGFEHDYGFDDDAIATQPGRNDASWYGLAHYLVYELNPRLSVGLRYEWFADADGLVVAGLGNPHGIPLSAVPANWNELSVGVNYKPNKNVLLRSEVRWDWADTRVPTVDRPFDDYSDGSQFLWGTDLIVKF